MCLVQSALPMSFLILQYVTGPYVYDGAVLSKAQNYYHWERNQVQNSHMCCQIVNSLNICWKMIKKHKRTSSELKSRKTKTQDSVRR